MKDELKSSRLVNFHVVIMKGKKVIKGFITLGVNIL